MVIDLFLFKGDVVVVIGVGIGIGEGIVYVFVNVGVKIVCVVCWKENIDWVVKDIRDNGGEVISV